MDDQPNKQAESNCLRQIADKESGFENIAVAEFSDRLIRLAKSKLNHRLNQRLDPEDIVQSVFRSFFRRHAENKFEFLQFNDVWRLLAAITYRKTMQTNRFHQQLIRDVRQESSACENSLAENKLGSDPTASALLVMNELLENILARLPDTHHSILLLRLEQFSIEEIAQQTNLSTRTVDRTLQLVRSIAEELCVD